MVLQYMCIVKHSLQTWISNFTLKFYYIKSLYVFVQTVVCFKYWIIKNNNLGLELLFLKNIISTILF